MLSQQLACGDRSSSDWQNDLRRLRDGGPGYRESAPAEDALWKIIEDPSSQADVRAEAALILRAQLDGEGTRRIRVAAASTASPKLRVALNRLADDAGDADLDAALEEVAAEHARNA